MTYVVDCSVAFKWLVVEPLTDKARALRDDFLNGVHELLAIDIFPAEIGNALLVAERRGRIPPGTGARLLTDVLNIHPVIHASLPDLLPRSYAIAAQMRQTVYDCLYVALAEREGCQFVTADDRLVRNLQPQFPFVVGLASLP
jgi:predicted nucleic acid-binding protein